jgi:hypothetical protein
MLVQLGFLIARYIHVVCTTLLVGGTLFYEMVVPVAIDDLKEEAQLSVFAKARWVFRWIVWLSALLIIISGVLTARRHWMTYKQGGEPALFGPAAVFVPSNDVSVLARPGWWFVAHISVGFVAVLIALFLTAGNTPPARPVGWMRLNLVVLLIVIFLASATRHMRLLGEEMPASSPPAVFSDSQ